MYRFDFVDLGKAKVAENGFVFDSPVLTRTGVFIYHNADGSRRREYRPQEEVFSEDHLRSLRGVAVTDGHQGRTVADSEHIIGTVLTEGRREDDNLTAEIVIHHPRRLGNRRELSLGYTVDLIPTPGRTDSGEEYDAIQRNLKCDHLAVVHRGRAGNARLRLDGDDAASEPIEPVEQPAPASAPSPAPQPATPTPVSPSMSQRQDGPVPTIVKKESKMTEVAPSAPPPAARLVLVRVDGIEYMTEPQIARELDAMRERIKEEATRADRAEAERDAEKSVTAKHEGAIAQIRLDAAIAARARMKLESEAVRLGVELRSDQTDREIRETVVRKLRGEDVRFDGKSDDYVAAAFDREIEVARKSAEQNSRNRQQVHGVFGLGGHVGPNQTPEPRRTDGAVNPSVQYGGQQQVPAMPMPVQQPLISAASARDRMIRNMVNGR